MLDLILLRFQNLEPVAASELGLLGALEPRDVLRLLFVVDCECNYATVDELLNVSFISRLAIPICLSPPPNWEVHEDHSQTVTDYAPNIVGKKSTATIWNSTARSSATIR